MKKEYTDIRLPGYLTRKEAEEVAQGILYGELKYGPRGRTIESRLG